MNSNCLLRDSQAASYFHSDAGCSSPVPERVYSNIILWQYVSLDFVIRPEQGSGEIKPTSKPLCESVCIVVRPQ